jgi:hypothetical protein
MRNKEGQSSEIEERPSWAYCSTCGLAEVVGCKGGSKYCNIMDITEALLGRMAKRGVIKETIDYLRSGDGIAIEYQGPEDERPYMYVTSADDDRRKSDASKKAFSEAEFNDVLAKVRAERISERVAAAAIISALGLEDDLAS